MGFDLWLEQELAWAQGRYEYRAMGTAVVSATDLFCRRDFDPQRRPPSMARLVGHFASLGHLNAHLQHHRPVALPAKPVTGRPDSTLRSRR